MEDDFLSGAIDNVLDGVTAATNPKKAVAKSTASSYAKTLMAAAKAAPVCLALGATPAISQAPARQPGGDPHVPSQSQNSILIEMPRMTVATTSAASVNVVYAIRHK